MAAFGGVTTVFAEVFIDLEINLVPRFTPRRWVGSKDVSTYASRGLKVLKLARTLSFGHSWDRARSDLGSSHRNKLQSVFKDQTSTPLLRNVTIGWLHVGRNEYAWQG
jgi:hypothetical protein